MDLNRILQEKYTNELRGTLKNFENCMMPPAFERFRERIKNMEVRDDDVWVASFPKSGTTWSQEMIWLIGHDLDYKGAETMQADRYPFVEITSMIDFKTFKDNHPEFKCPDFLLDPVSYIDNLPSPRYIKTHLPWNLLPLQIQNGIKKPKIIHVMRNPKDVLVSFYHHATLLHGFTGNLEEFFQIFINDKVDYGPYFHNILSFWNVRNRSNVLIIKYEDMQKDLRGVVNNVAKFMNKTIPDHEMPKLLKHLSFEEMKKNPAVNFEILVEFLRTCNAFELPDKKFMRAGKSGNYKECLTPDMIAALDDWTKKNLEGTGLKFDF